MTTYNGYTPTPTNPERIEYDLNQQEFWNAATMVYLFEQEFRPTEADADKLHDLLITCNTDPNHITNAQQEMGGDTVSPTATTVEVAPWDVIPDAVSVEQTHLEFVDMLKKYSVDKPLFGTAQTDCDHRRAFGDKHNNLMRCPACGFSRSPEGDFEKRLCAPHRSSGYVNWRTR